MDNVVEALIEIPLHSKNKYEVDNATGKIKLDRVIYASMVYPTEYGIIENKRVSNLTRRTLRHLLQQERKITCGKQTLWEQRKAQRLKRGLQQCRKRQQQWKVYKTGKERGVAWAAP